MSSLSGMPAGSANAPAAMATAGTRGRPFLDMHPQGDRGRDPRGDDMGDARGKIPAAR
jgi:hypothetical protein